jgi:hypothetical protein
MILHTFFTSPVTKDPICFQPFNLLSSLSRGGLIFSLPPDPIAGRTIGGCERVKEGIRNIYKYINIHHLPAQTFFTKPCERSVKEVKEGEIWELLINSSRHCLCQESIEK